DVPSFCMVHKMAILPDPQTCAKYFNCSDYGGSHIECRYPDLYSTQEKRCVNFTLVKCDSRTEPQAPCEYTQNLCHLGDKACPPCPKRLPSCVGILNGEQPFPGRLWKPDFVTCLHNRTIYIQYCENGYFHPVRKQCVINVTKADVKDYCLANKDSIIDDPTSCNRFYNCSRVAVSRKLTTSECHYPDLFSTITKSCQLFTSVNCDQRQETMAPCKINV
ncbi:uncharacterized protein LOC134240034, partial [Saccostrea cucullata]|uniref:uncharacterized protein LOC134240034 n=1 Tax=Saccostrea cuccullata TaxID=36930 RepID=UPI002ED58CB9